MKHLTKLAFAILTVLTFSACSEDQTAFNIEKVPGRATVQGTITYNEGATVSGGKLSYSYKPAADLKVFITVDNSSYDDNLSGSTVFETTTDANGKYSLEIPVPDYNVNISVRTAQFKGTHSTIKLPMSAETWFTAVAHQWNSSARDMPTAIWYALRQAMAKIFPPLSAKQ